GFYHTIENYNSSSKYWSIVSTYQSDKPIEHLSSHVHFIKTDVVYLFIGGIFKVTVDGGKNWSKWDAEYDLPNSQRDESPVIQSVIIDNNGDGRMYVDRITKQSRLTLSLTTKDFGQNWTID